jgi:predicted DCC family thiol-disulfide oxidoreductase YuxK
MMQPNSTFQRAHTLLYDGECGICRRSIQWIRNRDREGRIRAIAYQEPGVSREFPEITRDELERAMQLVSPEGRRWEGADAVEQVVRLLPVWKGLTPLFWIPGVRIVARRVYGWVARNRRRLGCGEHCRLPDR